MKIISIVLLSVLVIVSAIACGSGTPEEYSLHIMDVLEGQGEIYPSSGIYYYPAGTLVTVVAIPDDGWEFSYFSHADLKRGCGITLDYNNPILVTLDGDNWVAVVFTEVPTLTSYGKPCNDGFYSGIYGTDGECHVCPSTCSAPAGAENVSGMGFSVGAGVCCYWTNCTAYMCNTSSD